LFKKKDPEKSHKESTRRRTKMGLFSRKRDHTPAVPKEKLIPCDKIFLDPPAKYGNAPLLEPISEDQNEKYRAVLRHFQDDDLKLPENLNDLDNGTHANDRPLSDWEKFWLSRECFLRYLRANKWNTANAIKGLTKTLVWRREIGLTHGKEDKDPLTADKVAVENETGKQVILGFDNAKRPLYYMKNGRQNTESSFRQVQELVYMMETATTVAPQGVEKITVLVDFKSYKEPGIITDKAPPISIARMCLNVMQDHYPERLAKCVLINIPWFAWAFLKMMYPFLDPATKAKAIFDEPFENHIEPSQLDALYNGLLDFKYKHEVYWPDMVKKVDDLRLKRFDRFLKFGGIVGLSEYDTKGQHDELKYPVDMVI